MISTKRTERTGYCYGEGPKPCRVLLVAEKPGPQELRVGTPFVGETGAELDKILWRCGIDRESIYITNLVKDRPTGKEWSVTPEDIKRNEQALRREIEEVNPEIIATVGAVSSNYFLRDELEGDEDYKEIRTIHAIPYIGKDARTYFPTWHPAAGLHEDPASYQYIYHDFKQLAKLIKSGVEAFPDRVDRIGEKAQYIEWSDSFPGAEALYEHIKEKHQGWVAIDTEGGREDANEGGWGMLSWSVAHGEGYVVRPGSRRCLGALKQAIHDFGLRVIMHYGLHDIEVLRAYGVWEEEFDWWDTMVSAYVLCLEPQGLKALAYRHCGMKMKHYLDIVSPYSFDLQLEYLLKLDQEEWGEAEQIIEDKKTHIKITQPQGLNRRIKGIIKDVEKYAENTEENKAVDIWKRWKDIHDAVRAPAERKYGTIPVANLSHVPKELCIWYSGRDADSTGRVYVVLEQKLRAEGLYNTAVMDTAVLPMVEEMQRVGMHGDAEYFKQLVIKYNRQQGKIRKKIRDIVGYSINPESAPAVGKVLFKKIKLPVYKKTKKGKASTGQKAIEALKGEHEVVPLILEHRKINKNKTSFAEPLIEVIESYEDRRARTTIKYTRVASGRFSAEDPNLLAIPVRTALGLEIRNGFAAAEGHLLGSWDLSQIEMRFMAHESGEPQMIKGFNTNPKYDVHLETAAAMFGKREEDVAKYERYGAKRAGFGVITGITGMGLLDQFRLEGITQFDEDDCNYFIKAWLDVRKRVKVYMSECRAEAKRYGYVTESIGGRRRYLPGVHSTKASIREEALRQTHSHKISAGAQAIFKKGMAALRPYITEIRADLENWQHLWWLLQIHDELIYEFPKGIERVLDATIKSVLCTTVELKVPIKASGCWSERWGELK